MSFVFQLFINRLFNILFLFLTFSTFSAHSQNYINSTPAGSPLPAELLNVRSFPKGSLVLLADGTEKRIEDIKIGDLVAAYDPVLEDYIVTPVTHLQMHHRQPHYVSSVMLILDELSASIQVNGGLAGVTLQATRNSEVLTAMGPKKIDQLNEHDLLFCYDEATHRFHSFRVYEVSINNFVAETSFSLQTEQKNYIINSTVVLQRENL